MRLATISGNELDRTPQVQRITIPSRRLIGKDPMHYVPSFNTDIRHRIAAAKTPEQDGSKGVECSPA